MPFELYIYLGAFVTYCDPIFVLSITPISSPNPMFDHLLESSHRDDSNKWSNVGFGEEISILEIKICTLSGALIWDSLISASRPDIYDTSITSFIVNSPSVKASCFQGIFCLERMEWILFLS